MQETAGFDLNCTANDIQVAEATDIEIIGEGCAYPGAEVTFDANFLVVLNAQERHDLGLYFAIDGDTNVDGAITGECLITTAPYTPDPPWLDLDGTYDGGFCANDDSVFCETDRDCKSVGGTCDLTQDLCGDVDDVHTPLQQALRITTKCIDPDGDGQLNLPYCTSWRQPGANTLCLGPEDAFPGSPSKCYCDIGFNVPIAVPAATLAVVKEASPTEVDEPGGDVTFSVEVKNTSPFATFTLESLIDDIYGDITLISDGCSVPQTLAPGGSYSCSFPGSVTGQGGDEQTDTVTASVVDENGNEVNASDTATVHVIDLLPTIKVVKVANPTAVLESGGWVTYAVTVYNDSPGDSLTIDQLTDDVYGDLDGQGDCAVGGVVPTGGSYACSFTAWVEGQFRDQVIDEVKASATDEEGNEATGSDTAVVDILDVPSSMEVVKTVLPEAVDEPGGPVIYTFTVYNRSAVDEITIQDLADDIYGNLDGQGDCSVPQTLAPGASYSCSLKADVSGDVSTPLINVVTAVAVDDDKEPLKDTDDAMVTFNDVPPAASLTKTPTAAAVTYEVTVANESAAEPLTVTSLVDDTFGDITVAGTKEILETTCVAGHKLAPKGSEGDSYTCTFTAWVPSSPHVNTVTATVYDNDSADPATPSDSAQVTFSSLP